MIAAKPTEAELREGRRDGVIISIATTKMIAIPRFLGNINFCPPHPLCSPSSSRHNPLSPTGMLDFYSTA
jgi:hypothetical protein